MKKNLTSRVVSVLCISVLCIVAVVASGCGGDDPVSENCDNKIDSYDAAINAYIDDPTVAKCEAVKSSLTSLLSCPALTPSQKSQYQAAIDDIVCD